MAVSLIVAIAQEAVTASSIHLRAKNSTEKLHTPIALAADDTATSNGGNVYRST